MSLLPIVMESKSDFVLNCVSYESPIIKYFYQILQKIGEIWCSLFPDADLCHLFTEHLVELKQPIRGIEILKKAIRKIQLFDSQLTSIHADLCQLCLLSKCMKPALEFLETDVTSIGSEVSLLLNGLINFIVYLPIITLSFLHIAEYSCNFFSIYSKYIQKQTVMDSPYNFCNVHK